MIVIKRIHHPPDPNDGLRVLVDQVWPRGLRKERVRVDEWRKGLAPSNALRKWFGHVPRRWEEFKWRYPKELETRGKMDEVQKLADEAKRETITLLFGAGDEAHNNAVVLKEIIERLS